MCGKKTTFYLTDKRKSDQNVEKYITYCFIDKFYVYVRIRQTVWKPSMDDVSGMLQFWRLQFFVFRFIVGKGKAGRTEGSRNGSACETDGRSAKIPSPGFKVFETR